MANVPETMFYQPKDGEPYSIAWDKVPLDMMKVLATRTFRHAMSNEAMAAVTEGADGKSRDDLLHAWRLAYMDKVVNSTIGIREGGPRKDPTESEAWDLAEKDLKAIVRKQTGQALPPKASDIVTFKSGETIERKELLSRFFQSKQDHYMDLAKKAIAKRDRDAANGPAATSLADVLGAVVPSK